MPVRVRIQRPHKTSPVPLHHGDYVLVAGSVRFWRLGRDILRSPDRVHFHRVRGPFAFLFVVWVYHGVVVVPAGDAGVRVDR